MTRCLPTTCSSHSCGSSGRAPDLRTSYLIVAFCLSFATQQRCSRQWTSGDVPAIPSFPNFNSSSNILATSWEFHWCGVLVSLQLCYLLLYFFFCFFLTILFFHLLCTSCHPTNRHLDEAYWCSHCTVCLLRCIFHVLPLAMFAAVPYHVVMADCC